jgi:hypothetical protein
MRGHSPERNKARRQAIHPNPDADARTIKKAGRSVASPGPFFQKQSQSV